MILRTAHPCNEQRAKRPLELANDTMEAANALGTVMKTARRRRYAAR
jgi:hypothetical protein